ncbi:DoxX family protein [Streptomyces sp. NPDC014744]|uniref:DoxX family protein n=1 Tax=Streptomyces sp. NPDC014744 TaxID=3364903 RepID=UPI0036F6659E
MNIAYWIVAGLLALFYCYAGTLKVIRSRDQLRPMMAWVDHVPLPALRALGTAEILGAISGFTTAAGSTSNRPSPPDIPGFSQMEDHEQEAASGSIA